MKLFGRQEKKSCCKDAKYTDEVMEQAKNMQKSKGIKILGSGCDKCKALEQATKEALTQLQLPLEIEHVRDFAQIACYGVMTTPALVVDGKVVSFGKVLSSQEVVDLLKNYSEN